MSKKNGKLWLEIMSCQLIKKLKNERIGRKIQIIQMNMKRTKQIYIASFFILRKINKDLFISWIR